MGLFILQLFLGMIWGMIIGVYSAFKDLSTLKTVLLSAFGGIVVSLLAGIAYAQPPSVPFVKLRESTVHLIVGSGSIVEGRSGKHYLLTNWHVCNDAKWKGTLIASYPDGPTVKGYVVKLSPTKDLCAARVGQEYPALHLAPRILPFEEVHTRGYPNHILSESSGRAREDIVWRFDFPIEMVGECPQGTEKERDPSGKLIACGGEFLSTLTSLYGRPGSSGSPVVDNQGNLVGVISSWHPSSDHEAGMVTYAQVKEFLSDL